MSKYCPTWIIDCIIAEASIDFIELEVGLEFISKKYTEGIDAKASEVIKAYVGSAQEKKDKESMALAEKLNVDWDDTKNEATVKL